MWNRIRTKETWKKGGDGRKEDDETKTVTVTNGTITDTRTHICVNGTSNQRPQCWETSCDPLTLSLSPPVWFWREVGEIWTTFVPQIKQNGKQTTRCCTETNTESYEVLVNSACLGRNFKSGISDYWQIGILLNYHIYTIIFRQRLWAEIKHNCNLKKVKWKIFLCMSCQAQAQPLTSVFFFFF